MTHGYSWAMSNFLVTYQVQKGPLEKTCAEVLLKRTTYGHRETLHRYRGTSTIRRGRPLVPYDRLMPRVPAYSWGG